MFMRAVDGEFLLNDILWLKITLMQHTLNKYIIFWPKTMSQYIGLSEAAAPIVNGLFFGF